MALYSNSPALVVKNPQSSAPFFDPQQLMIQVFNLLSVLWCRVSKLLHVAGLHFRSGAWVWLGQVNASSSISIALFELVLWALNMLRQDLCAQTGTHFRELVASEKKRLLPFLKRNYTCIPAQSRHFWQSSVFVLSGHCLSIKFTYLRKTGRKHVQPVTCKLKMVHGPWCMAHNHPWFSSGAFAWLIQAWFEVAICMMIAPVDTKVATVHCTRSIASQKLWAMMMMTTLKFLGFSPRSDLISGIGEQAPGFWFWLPLYLTTLSHGWVLSSCVIFTACHAAKTRAAHVQVCDIFG